MMFGAMRSHGNENKTWRRLVEQMMSKPSKKSIINEQQKHISELHMGCDWDEAHLRCWCCGLRRKTERCHMTPKSIGGSDEPDNFLLMCSQCHEESPDVDKSVMLAWLKREHSEMHGDRFFRKALRDAFYDCGINKESLEDCSATVENIRNSTKSMSGKISTHFGVGMSHGTRVWAASETINALRSK